MAAGQRTGLRAAAAAAVRLPVAVVEVAAADLRVAAVVAAAAVLEGKINHLERPIDSSSVCLWVFLFSR